MSLINEKYDINDENVQRAVFAQLISAIIDSSESKKIVLKNAKDFVNKDYSKFNINLEMNNGDMFITLGDENNE